MESAHIAIDLGASSGRAMLGVLDADQGKVELHEVHRFEHIGLPTPTGPVWNLTDIWRNVLEGLKLSRIHCAEKDIRVTSVGVDCWGVDWALLGESGELLALPHCYRDPQNIPAMERALEKLGGFDWLYERTGIQLMAINSLFQVAARHEREPKLFDAASHLIFVPDLFHYWLSGEIAVERTIASTSSMLDVKSGDWDREIFEKLGIPTHLLGKIVDPGTKLGTIRDDVAQTTGLPSDVAVVVPASHDTGSAVACVPAESESGQLDWAYLSSGTWSLLGAELLQPNTTPAAAEIPFTNELGINGTVRFLKNITGLWMVQELRREHQDETGEQVGFAELMKRAESSPAFQTLVDPNSAEFLAPGNMAGKIDAFADKTGQAKPDSIGGHVRCCLESLAFCYRDTLESMESVLGEKFSTLHVVGGGSKNRLLNQLTADALGYRVIAGPGEATAIGNVLIQAIGVNKVKDLSHLRSIVRDSFSPEQFVPGDDVETWNQSYERYKNLVASKSEES